jgi:ribosome-binding factor A
MAYNRGARISEEIKRELSDLIRDIKDPRLGFVTITSVEATSDLKHAKVFVSVYGSAEEKKNSLTALSNAKGFFRTEIGKRIRARTTPELTFKFDESIEHGAKIMQLLEGVKVKGAEPIDE